MKEANKTRENDRKYYLSEFSYDDGEYEITFNIIDVDFLRQTVTVAISRCGHIKQDTFALIRDQNGKLISSTDCSMKTKFGSKISNMSRRNNV